MFVKEMPVTKLFNNDCDAIIAIIIKKLIIPLAKEFDEILRKKHIYFTRKLYYNKC